VVKVKKYSFASTDPFMRVDYILCSPAFLCEIEAEQTGHFPSTESDHFPVVFDFKINKKNQ